MIREKINGFTEKYRFFKEYPKLNINATLEKIKLDSTSKDIVFDIEKKYIGEYVAFLSEGFVVRRFTNYATGKTKDFFQIEQGMQWLATEN